MSTGSTYSASTRRRRSNSPEQNSPLLLEAAAAYMANHAHFHRMKESKYTVSAKFAWYVAG